MTGAFIRAVRPSLCVSINCHAAIVVGQWVYLFMNHERQTVCRECAERRWGYRTGDTAPAAVKPTSSPAKIGFDSTKSILQKLQRHANANDPKLRQSGGDR